MGWRQRIGWFAVTKRARNPRTRPTATKREKVRDVYVARPFAGLPDEVEWIALRELVPAATAPLTLAPALAERYPDRSVTLATVLPMAWPAMIRPDGRIFIGLQRHQQSGDVSRDLAEAVLRALDTEPGATVTVPALPGEGPRLADVLAVEPLQVTVHDGYEFWLDPGAIDDPNVKASLEQANAAIYPTVRLAAAPAAYWCRVTGKAHVRWVLPDDEEPALDALSRLAGAGELVLGDGTRFAGMFRAHGLLVPVWDLPPRSEAAEWEAPVADFAKRYADALGVADPITPAERRARQGLLARQLTVR
ncbi:MAG: hypothetical protein QOI74_238 [Micromonosporaceae bacterium]|jgi:hypothetical protein|nr:hypothetical protein [Micromonosporaceae bacterium]MDT5035630.1 hypothetical protein [Micromonosporaceae bacterium]